MVAVQTLLLRRSHVVQRMDGADVPAIAYEARQEEKGNTAEHRHPHLCRRIDKDGHAKHSERSNGSDKVEIGIRV